MKKRNLRLITLSLCSALILLYNDCGQNTAQQFTVLADTGTTGVGNPMTAKNVAQKVTESLCQVISTCATTPISANECYTGMQSVTNIVSLLGASAQTYPTLGDLINANGSGVVTGNTVVATSSISQILGESCGSAAVQGVLGSNRPNYTNAFAMVPSSSATIFSPPTAIYRSVGPGNTSALATGAANPMTISGSSATFASGLPNNVGVGDAVQYQVGAASAIAFVTSRTSGTAYTLASAAGGVPTATAGNSSWSIFRAYTSLCNAVCSSLGGVENTGINSNVRNFDMWSRGRDIVTPNEQWNFALYADGIDTAAVDFNYSGNYWVTSNINFIRVYTPYLTTEVGVTQRHSGVWTSSGYQLVVNATAYWGLNSLAGYVWIDGLQIELDNPRSGNGGALQINNTSGTWGKLSNNIVRSVAPGSTNMIGLGAYYGVQGASLFAWNNIVYGFTGSTQACLYVQAGNNYLYNNTVANCYYGIWLRSTGSYFVKNNIVQASNVGFTSLYSDYSGDYNVFGDGSSVGGAHDKSNQTVTFVNAAGNDFRLSINDVAAKGAGVDLSSDPDLAFTTDIANILRADPWDVGASTSH